MEKVYRARPAGWFNLGLFILFGIVMAFSLVFWLTIDAIANDRLIAIISIIIPSILIFGVIGMLFSYLIVFRRMYYVTLRDDVVLIGRGGIFPKKVEYDLVHSISFEGQMIKSIDLVHPLYWPTYMVFNDTQALVNDFKVYYKKKTKHELLRLYKWDAS
jgi:hypothetical protein